MSDEIVLCADGKLGMLLIRSGDGMSGVQVPGEDSHRWIADTDFSGHEGALRQNGAPEFPPYSDDIMQLALLNNWVNRR